jgi:hypothetical protein
MGQDRANLSEREAHGFGYFQQALDRRVTQTLAAQPLRASASQIKRMCQAVRERGAKGV